MIEFELKKPTIKFEILNQSPNDAPAPFGEDRGRLTMNGGAVAGGSSTVVGNNV